MIYNKGITLLKTTLLILSFSAFFSTAHAQSKYFKGYVIMLNGDSLKGELKKNPKREFDNFSKAAYRKNEGGEIKTFNATKIKEYSVDGTIFQSVKIDDEQQFIKQLSKGVLNLFELQFEMVQMNEINIKSEYYMQKNNGELVKLKSGKFKKQITEAMAENPEIITMLDDKKYDYDHLTEVFNAYNTAHK